MKRLVGTGAVALALALALSGCAGLLGGGAKPPATLVTLTSEAAEPEPAARNAVAGQSVTIAAPVVSRELSSVRVPVQLTPSDVQYVTNLQLADTPARLFADLLSETVRRTTNRVVLGAGQTTLEPGIVISGQLRRFGYDAASGEVVVTYDAALSSAGGSHVETRHFTATAPADGTGPGVAPALNRAANQVALDVAKWIGNSGS